MTKQELLGSLGECLVQEYFERCEYTVQMSEDKYDTHKDMTICTKFGPQEVEVKTQIPKQFGKDRNGNLCEVFTVPCSKTQTAKCKHVKNLIFVRVPYYEMKSAIEIWAAPIPEHRAFRKEQNHGFYTLSIPIRNCKLVTVINNDMLADMMRDLSLVDDQWKYKGRTFYSENTYE